MRRANWQVFAPEAGCRDDHILMSTDWDSDMEFEPVPRDLASFRFTSVTTSGVAAFTNIGAMCAGLVVTVDAYYMNIQQWKFHTLHPHTWGERGRVTENPALPQLCALVLPARLFIEVYDDYKKATYPKSP